MCRELCSSEGNWGGTLSKEKIRKARRKNKYQQCFSFKNQGMTERLSIGTLDTTLPVKNSEMQNLPLQF